MGLIMLPVISDEVFMACHDAKLADFDSLKATFERMTKDNGAINDTVYGAQKTMDAVAITGDVGARSLELMQTIMFACVTTILSMVEKQLELDAKDK